MLYQPTTSELMNQFSSAINSISDIQQDIDAVKSAAQDRLKVLDMQYEYLLQSTEILKETTAADKNTIVFAGTNILDGVYDSYGITVHPKFKKTPSNILNFKTTTGYLFKNNITTTVSINGSDEKEDTDYIEVFKHDSIESKGYTIKEYDDPNISLTVSLKDDKTLGNVNFNVIELLPYLSGSFNMTIEFFERNAESPNAAYTQSISNVSRSRIILQDKIGFSKVRFNIRLKFKNSNNKYVFGLKHIYFLNASMEEDGSYIVVKSTKTSNINYLYNDMLFKTQQGVYVGYDLSDFNIEAYANYDYDYNVLSRTIEASTKADPRYISLNINTLYFKIPITTGTISFVPNIVTE